MQVLKKEPCREAFSDSACMRRTKGQLNDEDAVKKMRFHAMGWNSPVAPP